MTAYPSETSLVVNATQQQLSGGNFKAGVAIAPTQKEESVGGYDIKFDSATRLELQYKAVYNEVTDRTFQPRISQEAAKFPFNGRQAATLLGRQTNPGIAFYTLPVVLDASGLGTILSSTIFVDVMGLEKLPKFPNRLNEYSAFWVAKNGRVPTFSDVFLKDKTEGRYSSPRAYHQIPREFVYSWSEIEKLTRIHQTGVPIRVNGNGSGTGYRRMIEYESAVMEHEIRKMLDDGADLWSVIQDISSLSKSVHTAIQRTRQRSMDQYSEFDTILDRHPYLIDPKFDYEHQVAAIESALEIPSRETDDDSMKINFSGLDPRQGSRFRQYRYLTFGKKSEVLRVLIGFK